MINNDKLFTKCDQVEENDMPLVLEIGNQMLKYAKKNHLTLLTANQVGYAKRFCVIIDTDKDSKYDIFVNPSIDRTPISDGLVSVQQNAIKIPIKIVSLPKKRIMVECVDKITVSGFSINKADYTTFSVDGELASIWQTANYILNGVREEDIIESDFLTVKNDSKKHPNDKCPKCGKKNKRCICDS